MYVCVRVCVSEHVCEHVRGCVSMCVRMYRYVSMCLCMLDVQSVNDIMHA